jgi:hypothetical protein
MKEKTDHMDPINATNNAIWVDLVMADCYLAAAKGELLKLHAQLHSQADALRIESIESPKL